MEFLSEPRGELWLYYSFAQHLKDGFIPYKDFLPEYPPFSLPFFWLSNIWGSHWFTLAFYSLILLSLIFSCFIIFKLRGNIFVFLAIVLSLGGLFWDRFDIFPVTFVLLSIYLIKNKKFTLSFLAMTIGVLVKIYPVIFFPLLIWEAKRKAVKPMVLSILFSITVIGFVLFNGGFIGLKNLLQYNINRGIQIESIRAIPLLINGLKDNKSVTIEYKHSTYEIR
jgi:hypothetical protein